MTWERLPATQLTPNINRRAINQALKDDAALNSTFIGQERAREALTFGLNIDSTGYNLYVMGTLPAASLWLRNTSNGM